jgi:hypothetical protein
MRTYSPYDLLTKGRRYPPVLLSASLADKQVCFHEPLMFAKRLADCHPKNVAVTFVETGGFGHNGCVQRYGVLSELARLRAFAVWATENPWRSLMILPSQQEERLAHVCEDLVLQNEMTKQTLSETNSELEAVKKQLQKALLQAAKK